jgi:hypothetical protein
VSLLVASDQLTVLLVLPLQDIPSLGHQRVDSDSAALIGDPEKPVSRGSVNRLSPLSAPQAVFCQGRRKRDDNDDDDYKQPLTKKDRLSLAEIEEAFDFDDCEQILTKNNCPSFEEAEATYIQGESSITNLDSPWHATSGPFSSNHNAEALASYVRSFILALLLVVRAHAITVG